MSYQDFVIQITEFMLSTQSFRLRVDRAGERQGMPVGQTIARKLEPAIYELQAKIAAGTASDDEIKTFGDLLGKLLFPDGDVRDLLISRFSNLGANKLRLVLQVGLDAQPLAGIAWEYVRWDKDDLASNELAKNTDFSVVRTETLVGQEQTQFATFNSNEKVRVLVALSAPKNVDPLDLGKDAQNLERLKQRVADRVEIEILDGAKESVTLDVLREKIRYGGFHVLHLAGHGYFAAGMGTTPGEVVGMGGLVLMQPDGTPYLCNADNLVRFLQDTKLRLVVLATCQGGQRDDTNRWSSLTSALLKVPIPAVIGMQFEIGDENAIKFGEKFYRDIAEGGILDEAVTEGRLAMTDGEWGTPVVYVRGVGDLVLFPRANDQKFDTQPGTNGSDVKVKPAATHAYERASWPNDKVRKLLTESYGVDQTGFTTLCADIPEIAPVRFQFASGMGMDDRIDKLINFCDINETWGTLLKALDKKFPKRFQRILSE